MASRHPFARMKQCLLIIFIHININWKEKRNNQVHSFSSLLHNQFVRKFNLNSKNSNCRRKTVLENQGNNAKEEKENNEYFSSDCKNLNKLNRRSFVLQSAIGATALTTLTSYSEPSNAFHRFRKKKAKDPVEQSKVGIQVQSIDEALLNLLPFNKTNAVFRRLQKLILQDINFPLELTSGVDLDDTTTNYTWAVAKNSTLLMLQTIDNKRSALEPVFIEDDSTLEAIMKQERGEILIEETRNYIVKLLQAVEERNITAATNARKKSIIALSEVGESLIEKYPYEVPKEGKFSYLPRLLGRAKVTFVMKRKSKFLGNITILADGYAAPITAGNFIDLCSRGFYTGLPVKFSKKRLGLIPEEGFEKDTEELGSTLAAKIGSVLVNPLTQQRDEFLDMTDSDYFTINPPTFGSYQEGFYDPLTAKPRRIPIEILRTDRKSGKLQLSYWPFDPSVLQSSLENDQKNKPAVTFDIPGLVALNHPDRFFNFGSSEFFSLSNEKDMPIKAELMNGQYSAFGYVLYGYDNVLKKLQNGDVIADTIVGEYGLQKLVKIRQASFADVIQGE